MIDAKFMCCVFMARLLGPVLVCYCSRLLISWLLSLELTNWLALFGDAIPEEF